MQVLVNAIINSGPREDSTRIGRAGTVRRQAVDVSPLRRVNQAIWLLCTGAREASFRNIKSIAECLADELINAAKVGCVLYTIFKYDEVFINGQYSNPLSGNLPRYALLYPSYLFNSRSFYLC